MIKFNPPVKHRFRRIVMADHTSPDTHPIFISSLKVAGEADGFRDRDMISLYDLGVAGGTAKLFIPAEGF